MAYQRQSYYQRPPIVGQLSGVHLGGLRLNEYYYSDGSAQYVDMKNHLGHNNKIPCPYFYENTGGWASWSKSPTWTKIPKNSKVLITWNSEATLSKFGCNLYLGRYGAKTVWLKPSGLSPTQIKVAEKRGCSDPTATNLDPNRTIDDDSLCTYDTVLCKDGITRARVLVRGIQGQVLQTNPAICLHKCWDGSLVVKESDCADRHGCTDSNYVEYDPDATKLDATKCIRIKHKWCATTQTNIPVTDICPAPKTFGCKDSNYVEYDAKADLADNNRCKTLKNKWCATTQTNIPVTDICPAPTPIVVTPTPQPTPIVVTPTPQPTPIVVTPTPKPPQLAVCSTDVMWCANGSTVTRNSDKSCQFDKCRDGSKASTQKPTLTEAQIRELESEALKTTLKGSLINNINVMIRENGLEKVADWVFSRTSDRMWGQEFTDYAQKYVGYYKANLKSLAEAKFSGVSRAWGGFKIEIKEPKANYISAGSEAGQPILVPMPTASHAPVVAVQSASAYKPKTASATYRRY
ncbi:MAG: hypothetical protein VX409_02860 [Verrucomicrobiota bacterium]|nr:hypothetical protein [Verrucomicrobiota bacterium]